MEMTCIMCPVGCTLKVEEKEGKIVVSGNACPRGEEYGIKEMTAPERHVTTVKKFKKGTISLKTDSPVPKKMMDDVLRAVAREKEPREIAVGDRFIENVCGTTSNIVVTEINL